MVAGRAKHPQADREKGQGEDALAAEGDAPPASSPATANARVDVRLNALVHKCVDLLFVAAAADEGAAAANTELPAATSRRRRPAPCR